MSIIKDMRDRTPENLVCSRCGKIVVSASDSKRFAQVEIGRRMMAHRCVLGDESKRDFHDEVR